MSDLLSAIAILVSIASAVYTYVQNNKINAINMKASHFHIIFDNFLINEIPTGRNYLRFENNKLVDTQYLCDALSSMMVSCLYFRYQDKEFYLKLKNITQNIEDYIMECGNKIYIQEEQAEVYNNIQSKLEELYEYINKKYIGN